MADDLVTGRPLLVILAGERGAPVTEGCLDSCSYEASLWDFVNNYHYASGAHEGTFTRKAVGMCAACFQSFFFYFQFGQVFISNKATKKKKSIDSSLTQSGICSQDALSCLYKQNFKLLAAAV